MKQLSLTRGQIFKMRSKQLQNALELQNKNEKSINLHLYHIFSILSSLIHHKTLALKMKNIENRVIDREKLNDYKRNQKLKRLKTHTTEHIFNKIEIRNFTNKTIPHNVEKFLQLGLKHGIGGNSNKFTNLNKMEGLFSRWLYYAQSIELNIFKINEIKSLLYLEFEKLNTCNTNTLGAQELKHFLNSNQELVLLPVDKIKMLL